MFTYFVHYMQTKSISQRIIRLLKTAAIKDFTRERAISFDPDAMRVAVMRLSPMVLLLAM